MNIELQDESNYVFRFGKWVWMILVYHIVGTEFVFGFKVNIYLFVVFIVGYFY